MNHSNYQDPYNSYFGSCLQIDEETWISKRPGMNGDDTNEYRDICTDYPGVDDFVHQEELGYRKGIQAI